MPAFTYWSYFQTVHFRSRGRMWEKEKESGSVYKNKQNTKYGKKKSATFISQQLITKIASIFVKYYSSGKTSFYPRRPSLICKDKLTILLSLGWKFQESVCCRYLRYWYDMKHVDGGAIVVRRTGELVTKNPLQHIGRYGVHALNLWINK